ncbi:uncharacterized protein JCM6883_000745 [Sporobolomyces salmoneus]|uniref:uncharacterized protein n=1 Tax=Sporobolomyces salmoneus TaxID=183962 RepID=UPI00316D537B
MSSTSPSSSSSPSDSTPALPDLPLTPEPLSNDPAELTPDLEDDIDLSTLRFISSTLRETWIPYLGWIIVFTSFAKLTRFSSPFVFRATRWTADWGFWGFEKLLQFLAWSSMWLGMLAAVIWILGGIGMLTTWAAIKAKPRWRKALEERPALTKFVARATVEFVCWRLARRWLWRWIGKGVLAVSLGWEAFALLQATTSREERKSPRPSLPRKLTDQNEQLEGEEQAEQWARKVREDMLKESLLRRGKTSNKTEERESETEA